MFLNGKVAIVTGASRGIGKAIALAMAGAQADIVVNYAGRSEAAEETAAAIRQLGRRALVHRADVSNTQEVQQMVEATIAEFGKVDILVNNAGITRDNLILRMKEEDWDTVLAVNLKSAFNTIKAVAKPMVKARYGRIINVSSVVGIYGNPGQANYAAAKAGLIGLTKTMAKELGPRNITVNAVAPGFITTDMTEHLSTEAKEKLTSSIALNRLGRPEDVASLVAFLASDFCGYITGQVIAVDGGLTI
ncbi:3-oxoacyl-(acyl-carrier-protein) reductase [Desulfotomaculum nigrificans CO-1-SRB]|uniref:3-oxoacyl-[acyl-carrier-protein] reductase n=1 Tax=Desulfotomaculum nigrificans (strain DSM 14880 / VKM B-2319 / CO-1-SRB) TaxID=868595 RepID=F6B352_DESCC|nr:3-oxoacyl-[acyl-carrier-protein] reductase [Desulfotomaculum nigrificans]AEF93956.1 3-oxoacyl-(acyl-carrier-protein) reductase [Desulfotomaculum nigrificans CO-1-SRB]